MNPQALGDFVAEELITNLIIHGNLEVVERRELDRVLQEHELYTDGIFDADSIAKLEKLLGIDVLVTGSIANLGDRVKINARAISVETARAFAAGSATVEKDVTVNELLGQVAASSTRSGTNAGSGFRTQSSDTFFRNDFLHIVPTGISKSEEGAELKVITEFRNVSRKELTLAFLKDSLSALSDAGDDFLYNSVDGIATLGKFNTKTDPLRYTVIAPGSHAIVIWRFKKGRKTGVIQGSTFSIGGQVFRLTGSNPTSFSVGLSGLQL